MTVVVPLKVPHLLECTSDITDFIAPQRLMPLARALHNILRRKTRVHILELVELAAELTGSKEIAEILEEINRNSERDNVDVAEIIQSIKIKSAEEGVNFEEKWAEIMKIIERFAEVWLIRIEQNEIVYTPERARELFLRIAETI
ncbi:hypothetical protein [Thermococcus sp. LS2]|uniref:hypothetical protein n=1 Tax=Thermococcus sp. LS2 TaxID=1638260 RepID=UPI00143A1352|nr:hypothetical protein [Thermococcus sp. LS2]NJE13746.1 hypothetical protein [Thermococcus sp. LS2]